MRLKRSIAWGTPIQMILDYFTVFVAFYGGYFIYRYLYLYMDIGVGIQPYKLYRNLAIGSGFLFIIIFERFGLYSRNFGVLNVEEIKRILQSLLIGSLILFSISFLFRPIMDTAGVDFGVPPISSGKTRMLEQGQLLYSRLILMYSLILLLILINMQRHVVNRILLRMHLRGPGLNRVLIYGAGEVGKLLARQLFENPRIGLKPVGFVDDDIDKVGTEIEGMMGNEGARIKVLGNGLQLQEIMQSWDIDEVIIAMPSARTSRIYEIINTCIQMKVKFSFVPNLYDMFIQQVHFEEINGIPLLRLKSSHKSYIYLAAKRVFDILFASIFIVVSIPFWPIICLLIKIESEGPVIFCQIRIGKDGKPFTIYKFRSLRCDSCVYERSPTAKDDPRITRVGRWLRRFSLDEFPQFWNVLKGDMSIVGPRPEMPYVVDNYTPIQKQRLKARPGLTGIWQISSARTAEIHENLDYDLYYTENQSFLLDLVVIAKTIAAAIKGKGV
jgi:exopolysaccharide biosynthesis polyprenyl glycosylphosphotransferase